MTLLRTLAAVMAFAALAACGADGEPERPQPRTAQGLTISGTAGVGIVGGG